MEVRILLVYDFRLVGLLYEIPCVSFADRDLGRRGEESKLDNSGGSVDGGPVGPEPES